MEKFLPTRSQRLKITNIIFNSIQLEVQLLKQDREFYNPNKFSSQIQKSYICNRRLELIGYLALYSVNSTIFYFFPLWFFMFPFYLFSNFQIWRSAWLKISVSVSEYKLWTKNSLTFTLKGAANLQVVISFFPFIFGISYIIYSRYQNQVFSYFLHKNLPGIYPSYPKLTWETFQHITSSELKLDPTQKTCVLDYEISNKHFSPRQSLTNQIETLKDFNSVKSQLTDFDEDVAQKRDLCSKQNDKSQKNYTKSDFQLTKEAREQKHSGFIKQLDFYSDSFLIKLNSKWANKKNQGYVGIFPKKSFFGPFSISPNLFKKPKISLGSFALPQVDEQSTEATPHNNFSIGTTWHLVSPKNFLTFPSDGLSQIWNQEKDVVKTENLILTQLTNFKFNLNTNSSKKANFFNNQPTSKIIKNYWQIFYFNLDELPKKLNSINTNSSVFNLTGSNLNKKTPLLPIKKYSEERQKFLTNTLANTDSFPEAEYKFSQKSKKVIFSKSNFLVNKIDPQINLTSQNKLSSRILYGFSNQYQAQSRVLDNRANTINKVGLKSESIFFNKLHLLQNELRQFFYNTQLKPNFLLLEPTLNASSSQSLLNLVIGKDFNFDETKIPKNSDFIKILEQSNNEILLTNPHLKQLTSSSKSEDEYLEQILQILQDFVSFKANLATPPRAMSGYDFPDSTNTEVRSLILQFFYQKKLPIIKSLLPTSKIKNKLDLFSPSFKVELSPSFTSYSNYNYLQSKVPTLKLNYRPTFLEGVKKTLYQGPGVLRETFTHDFSLRNKEEIRRWIKPFLSSDNPLTDRRKAFFGHKLMQFDVPAFAPAKGLTPTVALTGTAREEQDYQAKLDYRGDNGFSLKKDSDLSLAPLSNMVRIELESIKKTISPNKFLKLQKDILKLKNVQTHFHLDPKSKSIKLPVVAFTEEFQVPYLTKSKWHTILEKLRAQIAKQLEDKSEEEKSELEKKLQINVPVVRIRNPKQQAIQWPLNKLDYENLNDFVFSSPVSLFKHYNWTTAKDLTPSEQGYQAKLDNQGNSISNKLGDSQQKNLLEKSSYYLNTRYSNKLAALRNSSILFEDIIYDKLNQKENTFLGLNRRVKPVTEQNNLIRINYHYVPSVQMVLSENATQKKIFGNVYKKAFTVYQNIIENNYESFNSYKRKNYVKNTFLNNFSNVFYQSWEPITSGSWMMITQLSFGLVVLQIFQDVYRKYGKELISYVFDLLAALGIMDPSLKEELGIDDRRTGFRIIRKVSKRFRDIAGIDGILPELGEIVWFLRNSGRSFKVGNIIPKGILLVGSPGTGKTLLVQAIAGEAEVPVLVQSGSSLNDPEQEEGGAQQLTNLFEQARQMAPCIVFIDEIDALGEKRENVIQNPMGTDEVIEAIQESSESNPASLLSNTKNLRDLTSTQFIPKPKIKFNKTQINNLDGDQQNVLDFSVQEEGAFRDFESYENSSLGIIQQSIDKQEAKQEQLRLLMQFLIEMDGLRARKGVIVIGATNRPDVLDLALTRPGRFDQILHLGLPEKQKRIEILKLYSKNLGTENTISWDYLANRTIGFSAADLAAVMNESSMKAILSETVHTIQTIEQGIESITSYSTDKPKLQIPNSTDPFLISRLAYYQAGKAVVHTLLLQHPSVTVLHLWPRQKNARQTYISTIIQNKFLKISRKLELESRIVGLYAGKAAEFLVLSTNLSSKSEIPKSFSSNKPWQSDIGIEDLNFATSLVQSMISQWYFYSKDLVVRKSNPIFSQRNLQEIQELDTLELFNQLAIETETEIIQKTRSSGFNRDFQKWSIRPWWQTQITRQIGFLDPAYDDWYRIYLPDPEESERNDEWIPPDEFYHNNSNLTDLAVNSVNSSVNWNDLYAMDRDYIYHGLLLSCFNTAFSILDKNRELLDYFAAYLMRNDILRQHEINEILYKFKPESSLSKNTELIHKNEILNENKTNEQKLFIQKNKKTRVIEKAWGQYSRRTIFRFFNFDSILSKS